MPCLAEDPNKPIDENEDPNAKNGLMTKVWGPAGWLFLHCVTFGYPLDPDQFDRDNNYPVGSTKIKYRNFFHSAGDVFPCKYCRESYKEFMKQIPIEQALESRGQITHWLWKMHNLVNKKLGISYCDSSFPEIKERYESYRAKCKALSKAEVESNETKGCVVPADGHPKKCQINVVPFGTRNNKYRQASLYDGGTDQFRNYPAEQNWGTLLLWILVILMILIIVIVFYRLGK